MILITIIAALLFLASVEAFQRWLKVPGLEANGGRGYVAIALIAVCFTCFGFFSHYYIGQTTSANAIPRKPTVIKFASIGTSAKLDYPELVAYRESLTRVPDRFYPMVETVPYAQPTAAHYFTVAPGEAIETGYAFLIPADDLNAIRVLKVSREKDGGRDLSVFVPEANAGDHILLLLRTSREVNPYPGEVR